MRYRLALTVIVAVLAAACGPVADDGEAGEMPSEPDAAAPEADEDAAGNDEGDSDSSIDAESESDAADDPAQDDATGDQPDESEADDGEADEGEPAEVTVSIGDFFFEPDGLSVAVGDTVTWTHDGDITHNVTARDESFVSENLSSGETFSHTFAEAGSFEYRCTLHGQMLATIDVS